MVDLTAFVVLGAGVVIARVYLRATTPRNSTEDYEPEPPQIEALNSQQIPQPIPQQAPVRHYGLIPWTVIRKDELEYLREQLADRETELAKSGNANYMSDAKKMGDQYGDLQIKYWSAIGRIKGYKIQIRVYEWLIDYFMGLMDMDPATRNSVIQQARNSKGQFTRKDGKSTMPDFESISDEDEFDEAETVVQEELIEDEIEEEEEPEEEPFNFQKAFADAYKQHMDEHPEQNTKDVKAYWMHRNGRSYQFIASELGGLTASSAQQYCTTGKNKLKQIRITISDYPGHYFTVNGLGERDR